MAAVLLGLLGLALIALGAGRPTGSAGVRTGSVLVAARSIPAGATLSAADLALRSLPAAAAGLPGLPGLLASEGEAVGRRTVVALGAGTLVTSALLTGPATPLPGHRVVRARLDAAALPPSLQAGQLVEVMAAVVDGGTSSGRLLRVAEGRLVSVDPGGDGVSPPGAVQATVALDLDAAAAERVLWAETFAKALSLLAAPPGDPGPGGPSEVDGLAPSDSAR